MIKYFGPPGTGKTRKLIGILANVVKKFDPDRVGFYSFTRSAAYDAKKRAIAVTGYSWDDFPHFGTIHSECFRQIGISKSEVFGDREFYEFCNYYGYKVRLPQSVLKEKIEEEGFIDFFEDLPNADEGDKMLGLYLLSREKKKPLNQIYVDYISVFGSGDLNWDLFTTFVKRYNEYKRDKGIFDFTDFIEICLDRELIPELDVIFIDEAQDLTPLEWLYIKEMIKRAKMVFIAGDVDQCLYVWRGSIPDSFLSIRGLDRVLFQSHSVPILAWKIALPLISKNIRRKKFSYLPKLEKGELIYRYSEWDIDYEELSKEKTFILARNWIFLKKIAEILNQKGIAFKAKGIESLYKEIISEAIITMDSILKKEPIECKKIKTLFRFLPSKGNILRGIKKKVKDIDNNEVITPYEYIQFFTNDFLDKFKNITQAPSFLNINDKIKIYYTDLLMKDGINSLRQKPNIMLGTIHWSKGQEANNVVLLKGVTYKTYRSIQVFQEDERRVFYVGLTRTKNRLIILDNETKYKYDEI